MFFMPSPFAFGVSGCIGLIYGITGRLSIGAEWGGKKSSNSFGNLVIILAALCYTFIHSMGLRV